MYYKRKVMFEVLENQNNAEFNEYLGHCTN